MIRMILYLEILYYESHSLRRPTMHASSSVRSLSGGPSSLLGLHALLAPTLAHCCQANPRSPEAAVATRGGFARTLVHKPAVRREDFFLRCRHLAKQSTKLVRLRCAELIMLRRISREFKKTAAARKGRAVEREVVVVRDPTYTKRLPFQLFLCLSRARPGKMFIFNNKRPKRTRSSYQQGSLCCSETPGRSSPPARQNQRAPSTARLHRPDARP